MEFLIVVDGPEHQDELEADGVPPYEDRLGPDGAEGENPVLPQVTRAKECCPSGGKMRERILSYHS